MEENGLPASGDGEEACWAVVLLSSTYDFPFCFPFVSMMMKVTTFCLGSSFSDLQEAIKKTVMLTLVFWVFYLRLSFLYALFLLHVLFFFYFFWVSFFFFCSLIFSPFGRLPLPGFYKARDNLGGGNGWQNWCGALHLMEKRLCL